MKGSISKILTPTVVTIAIVIGAAIVMYTTGNNRDSQYINSKLAATLSLIEKEYVDTVSLDSLVELAIPELIKTLDPHSNYIPASQMQEANELLDAEFDGIGVVFNMATDTAIVMNVIPSGPSDKAGVKNGDRIIKVEDSLVAGVKLDQNGLVKLLRGKRGTRVTLQLQRGGLEELVPIEITRDKIQIKSIDASFMLTDSIGYIKLMTFSRTSYDELRKALKTLREQGMSKLVFDLRGNSGGFLDQAINLANEFLPRGNVIVYTENRAKKQYKEYSNGLGGSQDLELAILIDEGSASSSEILAGAIQDNDRGTIIGRRSFGKGLVQQQIPFRDGSALRLTIARYYTPTGRSIQKPYSDGSEAYSLDIINRYNHDEFFEVDSIKFSDSLKFTTPKGKVVYGGGGIMPDIFVPLDTLGVTPYFTEVAGKNILYKFTIEYSDKNRNRINSIKNFGQLDSFFRSRPDLLDDFIYYASKNGVKPNRKEIEESKELMLSQIKSYVSRNTPEGDNGFYYMLSKDDKTIKKAIEVLTE